MELYQLSDTRTIKHQMRMMITHNIINPKCYMVSKADDTTPAGLVKLTFKQDDFNPKTDNPSLLLCDYFTDSGDIAVGDNIPQAGVSKIKYMIINSDGELEESNSQAPVLIIGETYYFSATDPQWRIQFVGDYDEDSRITLEKLIVIRQVNDTTISLRPGKSNKLKGLSFILSAGDEDGAIILGVAE